MNILGICVDMAIVLANRRYRTSSWRIQKRFSSPVDDTYTGARRKDERLNLPERLTSLHMESI